MELIKLLAEPGKGHKRGRLFYLGDNKKTMEEMKMVSEKMKPFMANNSAIRAMFEEGKRMAAVYGAENVYDFSLGNPNVPVPEVNEAILEIVKEEAFNALHGYHEQRRL